MNPLLDHPLWRAEDLGKPIPDSPHAVSVAIPLWEHAVGYEERDPKVVDRLACGYPRFVYHPRIAELTQACEARFAGPGEICLPLPSARAAAAARDYINAGNGAKARVEAFGVHDVHAVVASASAASRAKAYWQHTGRIVSSRLAANTLERGPGDDGSGARAKEALRGRIAGIYEVTADHVFLYPTGMDAVTTAHELGLALAPGRNSVQFGFPYVDVLKVQEEFGPGAQFYPQEGDAAMKALADFLAENSISSIVTETPGNPLLETPDIPALSALAHGADALLIVDDTVATGLNVDVAPWADLIATSLTKNFSGYGDAMGGALIVVPEGSQKGRKAGELVKRASAEFEDLLWWEDAVVLERRSRDFGDRMTAINSNGLALARFLEAHPAVERVYYPGLGSSDHYDAIRRTDGGYSGLLSFLPVDCTSSATKVYDNLRVSKGPSLGTDYTLCCPYTILAHYGELDWAESCGVSRWLIRVSVGMEDIGDLKARFDEALGTI